LKLAVNEESRMPTILVVDDDAHIREVVQYALAREDYTVVTAADGREALERIRAGGIDLLVLDVLMPELDGLAVCRRVREHAPIPIIFLSSRGEEIDRILGLELGGDDYVAKPFSPRELATRVKAVLRRAQGHSGAAPAGELITHHRLEMNIPCHELRVDGTKIELTVTEFNVLRALLERPGHVLTRSQLIDRVRADDYHITERTIDTHIRRIRSKLRTHGLDPIATVHGLGYKAADEDGG
jgi:two-component system OmpR family response regulator